MSSREAILARVREALKGRDEHPHPGPLEAPSFDDPVQVFVERFARQGGGPAIVDREDPLDWFGELLAGDLVRSVEDAPDQPTLAIGPDVPDHLRPSGPYAEPHLATVGVSIAWGAVAETGTLILPPDGGRRAQLLPPVHVVWLPEDRVYGSLSDALAKIAERPTGAYGLHSGPSKSADIGRILVTGVHGPGKVVAALLRD